MQVNLGNVLDTTPAHDISREVFDRLDDRVAATYNRIERGRAVGEHGYESLNLPNTTDPAVIRDAVSRFNDPSAVVTVGIDGSVPDAATFTDVLEGDMDACHLDNVDPETVERLLDPLDLASTVVDVVSRSGTTVETLVNLLIVREAIVDAGVGWTDWMFVTISGEGNPRDPADKHDLLSLLVPDGVPGRLLILSTVGLAATALCGHDVEAVLEGAATQEARLFDSLFDPPAYACGAVSYVLAERGMQQNAMMPYVESLETFSERFAQLQAELFGKDGPSQTPLRMFDAIDRHSQLQLYRAGLRGRLVTLVRATEREGVAIPETDLDGLAYLDGSSFGDLLDAELEAIGASFAAADRPSVRIELDRADEYGLGELLYIVEATCVLYDEPASVDTLVQPAVEWGKCAVRGLLGSGDFEKADVVREKSWPVVEQSERVTHGDHGRDSVSAMTTEQSTGAFEVPSVLYPVPATDESPPQKTDTRPESVTRPHSEGGTMARGTVRTSVSLVDHLQVYGGIIIVVALSFLVGAALGSSTDGLARGVVPGDTTFIDAIEGAGQSVGFGAVGADYLSIRDDWELIQSERSTTCDALWTAGGSVAVMSVYLGASALILTLGIQSGDSIIVQQGRENPMYSLYLAVVIIVLIGPVEELIFRGIALDGPRRLWEPAPAIVLSSLVPVSIHLWSLSDEGLCVSLGTVLVLGSVLMVIYERSGNLLVIVLVHRPYNAVQFLMSYVQVTGLI